MNTPSPTTKVSHKGSITGFVLSVVSLATSAIGYGLIHSHFKNAATTSTGAVDKAVEKGATTVANGTGHVVLDLIAVPFLVVGIVLAIVAVVLIAVRLGKVRGGGLVFSILGAALAVWGFLLAVNAFSVIKAH